MRNEHFEATGRRGRPPRAEVYQRLDSQIAELWQRLGGLPSPLEAVDIWRGIWLEETHHSTAIEGNTLVLKQVEVLLAEGRAVGDKELREYLEVRGYADAADWVYLQATSPGAWAAGGLLTLTELRQVHRVLMTPVWDVAPHPAASEHEAPGNFREHEIQSFPGGMTPISWPLVPAQIDGWVHDINQLQPRTPTLAEELASLHARFERIHPFLDGNGRAGRLLLNLVLVRLGYPPAIVYKRQRSDYLRALRRADQSDTGQLGELIARAVLDNLYRFVVPAVAGPARLVPLAALANGRINAAALRTAAVRGRLQASRGADGHWRSTRNWVEDYLSARYRRDQQS
ncbi:MAG: Fic family protein [Actinomycetota bacterium]|nr:Fic family protein [Actinomycetota bacterium]MDQ3353407.1 Fic family protein [Actinomycetota bacterium]